MNRFMHFVIDHDQLWAQDVVVDGERQTTQPVGSVRSRQWNTASGNRRYRQTRNVVYTRTDMVEQNPTKIS